MAIHRARLACFLVWGLALSATSSASAQVRIPRENTLENLQLFAPVDPPYGDRPYLKEGFFFNYDYLCWSVQRPDAAIIGNPGQVHRVFDRRIFENLPETNALTTGDMVDEVHSGNRAEVGHIVDNCGWMIGYTSLHEETQRFAYRDAAVLFADPRGILVGGYETITDPVTNADIDADIDGDRVYGRFGEDLGTRLDQLPQALQNPALLPPHPDVDQPAFNGFGPNNTSVGRPFHAAGSLDPLFNLPYDGSPESFPNGSRPDLGDLVLPAVDFDDLVHTNFNEIWSLEAMSLRRLDRFIWGGHLELMGGVRFFVFEEEWHVQAIGGIFRNSWWHNEADNYILGPQIGTRWFRHCNRWGFSFETRFAPSVNFQSVRLRSTIGHRIKNPALTFQNTGNDSFHDYVFSPIGEVRLNWSFQLTRAIALRAGWTGAYVGGLARPSNMVIYTLPNLEIKTEDYLDDAFMQGINVGIEINR